jgi:DNA-binding transcriptional regulator YbjK
MRKNAVRRDRLCDAALDVLADRGGRGLTHRAVDRAAAVPEGTAKNYFASRDDLLRAAGERCVQVYVQELERAMRRPRSRRGRGALVEALTAVMRRAVRARRRQLLAYMELQVEAVRRAALRPAIGALARADLEAQAAAHRASGFAPTDSLGRFVLAINGALAALLSHPPELIRALGLDRLDVFVGALVDSTYPRRPRRSARAA